MVFPEFKAIIKPATTKQQGDRAEDEALKLMQQAGLRLLERNYRTPGRGGGDPENLKRIAVNQVHLIDSNTQHDQWLACLGLP